MNAQTYQGYLDAFNNRNFDKLLTYYAEDVEFTLPNAAPVKGRESIRKFYSQFEGKIAEEVVANDICESKDGRKLCVDMTTTFEFLTDFSDFLGRGPMNKGDKMVGRYLGWVSFYLMCG